MSKHFFRLEYRYEVDVEFTPKVFLNFDITVATPCPLIGADVLDVTGDAEVFDQVTLLLILSDKLEMNWLLCFIF